MADDAAVIDEGCGCCKPATKSAEDKVRDLLDRRAAVDERLRAIEPVLTGAVR